MENRWFLWVAGSFRHKCESRCVNRRVVGFRRMEVGTLNNKGSGDRGQEGSANPDPYRLGRVGVSLFI